MASESNSSKVQNNTTLNINKLVDVEKSNNRNLNKIQAPDPQVKPSGSAKRQFTSAHKLKVVTDYDACTSPSERGALLRREGIYHYTIASWKKQLGLQHENNKQKSSTPRTDSLLREIAQLKKKLAQAEAIIDLQKKVSELLGTHILPLENNGVN